MPEQTLATWEDFAEEMNAPGRDWKALLPPNVSPEKFRACAITAVKQNPNLLRCTARSLFNAISRAAQDGLLPDGREGFINDYNTKVKEGGKDVWYHVAQWQPMAYGLRKRARELDDIIIDCQVVYLNDKFLWHQGDDPRIEHTPAPLGKDRDAGEKVGAYAIFKKGGVILHREVMDYGQIEKVREKSKYPDSLMWKDFSEEGYRKTVLRRGIKTVPVSDSMAEIVTRDDLENFEFPNAPESDVVTPPKARNSEFTRAIEAKPEPEVLGDVSVKKEPEMVRAQDIPQNEQKNSMSAGPQQVSNEQIDPKAVREQERQDWIADAYTQLGKMNVREATDHRDAIIGAGVMTQKEEEAWIMMVDKHNRQIMDAAKNKGKK